MVRGPDMFGRDFVEFTLKKFRLIGTRARIKKTLQIVEDLIPTFHTLDDLQPIPQYLDYLITLNSGPSHVRFTEAELQQLAHVRDQLRHWQAAAPHGLRQPLPKPEHRRVAKVLMQLRYLLSDKIQTPIKEAGLIIFERDATEAEPLIWPQEVVIVLDHLRSPYNVGAIIRTMECVGLRRLISFGYTPRLDSRQVQRAAMGCEQDVEVEYADDGLAVIERLRQQGFKIAVLETIMPSQSVFALDPAQVQADKLALIVGNEEFGVDEALIAVADHLLHIPTFGKKNSLNVSIAFSITIYQVWAAMFGGHESADFADTRRYF